MSAEWGPLNMDPIVAAVGIALVTAMATDAWQQFRDVMVRWWRRVGADDPDGLAAELDAAQPQLVVVRQTGNVAAEQALVEYWQSRLHQTFGARPAGITELRDLYDELARALPDQEPTIAGSTVMNARASDSARVYQAGRDQHIAER